MATAGDTLIYGAYYVQSRMMTVDDSWTGEDEELEQKIKNKPLQPWRKDTPKLRRIRIK